jgi:hypothetical protein
MSLEQLLNHPAIQSSAVPLLASLLIAAIFLPLRLSGLGAAGGFLAAVYIIGNFAMEPLTATRKIVVVGAAAALLGAMADLAFKPTRAAGFVLGTLFGVASIWVFWTVLVQQPAARALLFGGATVLLLLWLTAVMLPLQDDPVRAGAAGLGLGLGCGTAAIFGASALLGQYGLALGTACGGVLLLLMIFGKRVTAGASLVLPVAAAGGLILAGAVLLAQLAWWAAAVVALAPLVVRLPLPTKSAVWLRAVLACFYSVLVAAGGCALAYLATRG